MIDKLPGGMVALLIEALGGTEKAEAALHQIVRTKCRAALGHPGATVGDVYNQAVQEGWLAEFLSLSIADLTAPHGTDKARRYKKTNQDEICAYVGAHPGVQSKNVSNDLGYRPRSTDSRMVRMRKQGMLVSRGTRGSMTYYLPADAPPTP